MALLSQTFSITKGGTLEHISQFLNQRIGLNAFLVKDIKAVSINPTVTQLTLVYEEYPAKVIDSIAPREGAIFASGVSSDDFDIRFLFNSPIDYRSIVSGTFSIDGIGLDTDKVYLDPDSNGYYLKVSASGTNFQTESFHTYQLDATTLLRTDGSSYPYTPVGGYLFHSLSSAHIGDYPSDYLSRRRGYVSIAVVRLSKNIGAQQAIAEFLSQRQLSNDSLISYVPVSTTVNNVDVYFLYISKLEPQIISSFPLNNALLPDVSAPGKVTFVYNTKLDKANVSSTNGLFSIEEGFATSTDVPANKVTLLDDLQTIQIDTSSYFTDQKIYSILSKPGLLSLEGLAKEKPEQWTIHIAAYEGSTVSGESGVTDHGELQGLSDDDHTQYHTDTRANSWLVTSPPFSGHTGSTSNPHAVTYTQVGAPSVAELTGHTGDTDIHYTMDSINITVDQVTDLDLTPYATNVALSGLIQDFTGHTGETGIHYTVDEIFIPVTQLDAGATASGWVPTSDGMGNVFWSYISGGGSDITETVFNAHVADFTGHTGDPLIHFTVESISHGDILEIGVNDHDTIDTHLASTSNPHSVTIAQVGGIASGVVTGHTGDSSIHFTQDDIFIPVTQLDPGATASGWVPTSDGLGNVFWSYISGGGSGVTEPAFNAHVADFTGHTGDTTIHFTQAEISITESQISDLQDYLLNVDGLSGDFTGHTGDTGVHYSQAQINISTGQLYDIDFSDYALNADLDAHTTNTSNPHAVTAAQVGAPTTSEFNALQDIVTGHTGNTGIHYTQGQISISSGQLYDVDFSDYALASDLSSHTSNTSNPHSVTAAQVGSPTTAQFTALSGVVTGHTGLTNIHFTEASIDHRNINAIGSYQHADIDLHIDDIANPHAVTASQVGAPTTAQFTGHTGAEDPHTGYLLANGTRSVAGELTATIAASDPAAFIRKNESDLGDLTNYLFVQSVSEIFTGHSGDTSIHYTQASISIPLSQLSDVSVESATSGESLVWDGSNWVASGVGGGEGGGPTSLDDLTDVAIYSVSHLDTIVYTGGEFANATIQSAGSTTVTLVDAGTNDYQLIFSSPTPLEPSNNLSDVSDVEEARDNLKVQYIVEDCTDLVHFSNYSIVGAGQAFTMAQNSVSAFHDPSCQGVLALSSATDTASGAGGARRSWSTDGFDFTTNGIYCFRFMTNSTTDIYVRVGMSNSVFTATSVPANAAFFELNSPLSSNWQAVVMSGSVATYSGLSFTSTDTLNTWKWAGIQGSSSGVYFYDMDTASQIAFIASIPASADRECRPFVNVISNAPSLGKHKRIYLDKFAYPVAASALPSGMWIM